MPFESDKPLTTEHVIRSTSKRHMVMQLREQNTETMNRECRRHHEKYWRIKLLKDNVRLVVCSKCGGQTYESTVT